jgi:hypothetical protein
MLGQVELDNSRIKANRNSQDKDISEVTRIRSNNNIEGHMQQEASRSTNNSTAGQAANKKSERLVKIPI